MATGYQSQISSAMDQDDAITDWESETNISDALVVGGIGPSGTVVANEISNGVVKMLIVGTAAVDITNAQGDVNGAVFENTPGEDAPA